MPTFNTETVKPPTRKDNPFRAPVKSIAGTEQVISFVTESDTAEATTAEIAKARVLLTEAGNELANPVTVRMREETLDDNLHVKVYFWTIKKVRHTGKVTAERAAKTPTATPRKAAAKPAGK